MLTYLLDTNNGRLYEQLYEQMKQDILQGVLKAGERLPSKRKLAEHLGVSVVTVETAYSQLMAEGYVESAEKRGYFVSQVEQALPRPAPKPFISTEGQEPNIFMDLKSNLISTEQFPFSVWAKIMRRALLEQDKRLLQPMKYNGIPELRQAIAGYLYQARGMRVHPEQILIGAGTEYLYGLLVQLLGRDRIYAVEDPGYQTIARIYEVNGAKYVPIPIDRQGLSVRALDKTAVDVVHISPSHHYPTGIVMPVSRRQELLRWAMSGPNRYIIEDDYDSEFRFVGRPIPTLYGDGESGRVIYINTFSKTLAPSIRISYLILPPQLMELYRARLGFYSCTVPSFEQYALAQFIDSGSFERHIARMKKLYRIRRNEIIAAIQSSPLSKRCTIFEQDAGLHFLARLDTGLPDMVLKSRAQSLGVRMACLSDYVYEKNPAYDHILVVNYAGIEMEKFPTALERLAGALDE